MFSYIAICPFFRVAQFIFVLNFLKILIEALTMKMFALFSFVSRGCLFYGPPGTGKTLVARALANECSQGERKVSFFMRKGADCLSKWVGESERQLRLLFDQVITVSLKHTDVFSENISMF